MSEQQDQKLAATTAQATQTSACRHPEAIGKRWGDHIIEERQAELAALFEQQRAWVAALEAERGKSAFAMVRLSGADVSWLAKHSGRDGLGAVPNLHLEGVDLSYAHLEGTILYCDN